MGVLSFERAKRPRKGLGQGYIGEGGVVGGVLVGVLEVHFS